MTNDLNVGKFSYGDGYGFADLISLTNLIPKTDNYDPNSQEAWALRKEIDDAVVYNKYLQGSAFQNNPSTGISIYSLNGESSHSATNYVNL
jgi:hypothetical protein